jgi:hypothetical protein
MQVQKGVYVQICYHLRHPTNKDLEIAKLFNNFRFFAFTQEKGGA